MTRVEKINAAIKIMFVEKGLSVITIQKELLSHNIDLGLGEILTIVTGLSYKPVKERQKSVNQVAKEKFKKVLEPVVRIAAENKIPNSKISYFLTVINCKHPNGKPFDKKRVDSILSEYNFPFVRWGKSIEITNEEIIKIFTSNLKSEELKKLENAHAR